MGLISRPCGRRNAFLVMYEARCRELVLADLVYRCNCNGYYNVASLILRQFKGRNGLEMRLHCKLWCNHAYTCPLQVQELQEDLQHRESRWSATLARYRLRIESLEAQNHELQGDLKMMEQERLQWWQQQVHILGGGQHKCKMQTYPLCDTICDVMWYYLNSLNYSAIELVPRPFPDFIFSTAQKQTLSWIEVTSVHCAGGGKYIDTPLDIIQVVSSLFINAASTERLLLQENQSTVKTHQHRFVFVYACLALWCY